LMDIVMPGIDGVEATRVIMEHSPCAILIVTASIKSNSSKIFEAMGYGALDVVNTPVLGRSGHPEAAKILLDKIVTIGVLIGQRKSKLANKELSRSANGKGKSKLSTPSATLPSLVILGASTGGPKA
ncbi:MAG TPA: chemotaxis response regulator protein-glutamate methylesterase, partial [Cyanothece sp. UBA12306]|nr:chemotaxis response regulator protein-glutamate methylesterase [Cyanothece sp. UBA12306]